MNQYILRNKMTGRYLFSNFNDIFFDIYPVVDMKEISLANIFSDEEINELKKIFFFKRNFNINDYIIITKDIEIRRLKLENINLKNRFEDYIKNRKI